MKKATNLSDNDLMEVFLLRKEKQSKQKEEEAKKKQAEAVQTKLQLLKKKN